MFVAVEGTLLYSLIRFRARKGLIPAQIRGNTNLEISWTVAAALILVVLTAVTFAKLSGIKNPASSGPAGLFAAGGHLYASVDQPPPPGDKALNIDVNGQQYIWRFTYPNGAYSYTTMVVPVDTTVVLRIRSQDVAHSWWSPKLGPKFDAIPGYTNKTWFKATKTGTFTGQCAEFCGSGHAVMTAKVTVVEPTAYQSWVDAQKRLIQQSQKEVVVERKQIQAQTGG